MYGSEAALPARTALAHRKRAKRTVAGMAVRTQNRRPQPAKHSRITE